MNDSATKYLHDWSVHPGRIVYAVCHGMSHFIHPDAVPLIPEEEPEA